MLETFTICKYVKIMANCVWKTGNIDRLICTIKIAYGCTNEYCSAVREFILLPINGTACLEKHKQLLEYQNYLLLRGI
jgi:hypothetical protein